MAQMAGLRWHDWLLSVGQNGCFYSSANRADNDALAYYVDAVRRAAEEKARLEGLVGAEARKPRWRRRVDSLRCLKGVDTATAADC